MSKSYRDLLKDPRWKAKSEEVKNKAGYKCEDCGSGEKLQAHHPKYVRGKQPWEYDDLQCLCASCHRKADFKRIAEKNGSAGFNGAPTDTLKGKYFHSFNEDGMVEWQGQVLGHVRDGYYLVQTYSWAMGEDYSCEIVHFEQMLHWFFYATNEAMRDSYDYGPASRRKVKLNSEDRE